MSETTVFGRGKGREEKNGKWKIRSQQKCRGNSFGASTSHSHSPERANDRRKKSEFIFLPLTLRCFMQIVLFRFCFPKLYLSRSHSSPPAYPPRGMPFVFSIIAMMERKKLPLYPNDSERISPHFSQVMVRINLFFFFNSEHFQVKQKRSASLRLRWVQRNFTANLSIIPSSSFSTRPTSFEIQNITF